MANLRGMTGTAWHVETLRINDDKRHKSRCLFYNNSLKICRHSKSAYCGIRCGGSSRCRYYNEEERTLSKPTDRSTTFQINSFNKFPKSIVTKQRNVAKEINSRPFKSILNLRIGDKLFHKHFGPIIIKEISDDIVTIVLENGSMKHLSVKHCLNNKLVRRC